MADTAKIRREIIALFNKNVRGCKPNTSASNARHDGKEGHWLEDKMNLKRNGKNEPDYKGFEMKNHTRSKTTFGDWSADKYIFRDPSSGITRDDFFDIFGSPNPLKKNRPSWSGAPCPRVDRWNKFGQRMRIRKDGGVTAVYSYAQDVRTSKAQIVPPVFRKGEVVLARWDAATLRARVENKFNNRGWFKCTQNKQGVYDGIVFGAPITFETWIDGVRRGDIFLDSGMYKGNARPYSNWRSNNSYWESLVVGKY